MNSTNGTNLIKNKQIKIQYVYLNITDFSHGSIKETESLGIYNGV